MESLVTLAITGTECIANKHSSLCIEIEISDSSKLSHAMNSQMQSREKIFALVDESTVHWLVFSAWPSREFSLTHDDCGHHVRSVEDRVTRIDDLCATALVWLIHEYGQNNPPALQKE